MRQGLTLVGPEVTYVKPYPQEALNGEAGLTTREIAEAIGVQHQHVNEKVRRNRDLLESQGFRIVGSVVNTTDSREVTMAVDVDTAKYLTATWKNSLGVGYFRYLLECEHVAENVVPKLMAELAGARATIAKLTAPTQRRIPGKGIVSVIVRTLRIVDIFGEVHEEIARERRLYSELSEGEKKRYKISQRAAVMRGMAALQDEDLNPKVIN